MPSPEFDSLKPRFSNLRGESAVPTTLADLRSAGENFCAYTSEPSGIEVLYDEADGVRVMTMTPLDGDLRGVIQYLHGGGYQLGSIESHRKLVGHIAKAAGAVAVSVDYRLSPEHRHPAQVEDSLTVYRWLLDRRYRPEEILVAGDSAGGGLALGTLLAIKEASLPMPAGAIAISPWTDMTISGGSMVTRAAADITATLATLPALRQALLSEEQWDDPTISPLSGDLAGLPPIFLQTGDAEVLRDDTIRFGAKASAAGVDVTFDIVPDMPHVFVKAIGSMPESDQALVRIGDFARRCLRSRAVTA